MAVKDVAPECEMPIFSVLKPIHPTKMIEFDTRVIEILANRTSAATSSTSLISSNRDVFIYAGAQLRDRIETAQFLHSPESIE
jgi:S-adenosylmethionine hydrolase